MYDTVVVQELQAFKEWQECIEDFCLLKWELSMRPSSVLELCLKIRCATRIEQSVIVDDGSQEQRMGDARIEGNFLGWLHIEESLLALLVEQQDVIGLKADDRELLAICSIAHQRNLLSLYTFRLILI